MGDNTTVKLKSETYYILQKSVHYSNLIVPETFGMWMTSNGRNFMFSHLADKRSVYKAQVHNSAKAV